MTDEVLMQSLVLALMKHEGQGDTRRVLENKVSKYNRSYIKVPKVEGSVIREQQFISKIRVK